jgi:hypothetical protein
MLQRIEHLNLLLTNSFPKLNIVISIITKRQSLHET